MFCTQISVLFFLGDYLSCANLTHLIRNIRYLYNKALVKDPSCLLYLNFGFSTNEKREQLNAIREITHPTPIPRNLQL